MFAYELCREQTSYLSSKPVTPPFSNLMMFSTSSRGNALHYDLWYPSEYKTSYGFSQLIDFWIANPES